MHWIALSPPEDQRQLWGWRALQFTPRVAQVDEALVLEVSASHRLWGGPERLLRRFLRARRGAAPVDHAQGATHLIALALLRLQLRGQPLPARLPDDLPLATLTAALPWLDMLERTGCRTWGQLRALPRGGVARRFGAALLQALGTAWGEQPETCRWLTLPEAFDQKLELPALATTAPELMWAVQRLLALLQAWLQARQRGVLALELEWTLDLRRLDGVPLPRHEQLTIRTAQPTQAMAHLRRLVGEHLARAVLRAPANHLRLRTLDTVPWAGANTSLLPDEQLQGERLHELVERLSVRLGEHNVRVPVARADHRPERRQQWVPARTPLRETPSGAQPAMAGDVLCPPWLLAEPLPLEMQGDRPCHQGALQLLARAQRIETGWWDAQRPGMVARDYFIARSPQAGLVWVFCQRPQAGGSVGGWFLHGLYA